MRIRRATVDDAAALSSLAARTFTETFGHLYPPEDLAFFLADAYPPFGDAPYPAAIDIADPLEPRDRLSVAFRLVLAIPHFIVLVFVLCAWGITTILAWFVILITGRYPRGLPRR